jgi:DNA-directed RNA polymerase subunit K/omega
MDAKLLKAAHEKIPSVPVLVNLISKRERELINGAKPLVNPATLLTDEDRRKNRSALDLDKCDIALAEVAQGKIIAEIDFDAIAKAEEAKTKWNAKHANVNSLYAD